MRNPRPRWRLATRIAGAAVLVGRMQNMDGARTHPRSRLGLLATLIGLGLLASATIGRQEDEPPAESPPTAVDPYQAAADPNWTVIEIRDGHGESCLVCPRSIDDRLVVLLYKGRRIHLHEGECVQIFKSSRVPMFARLQPRGALFDEPGVIPGTLSLPWLVGGVYVLFGLIIGAACANVAVGRGRSPLTWFVAGLFANLAGLVLLLTCSHKDTSVSPQGVPRGLCKVPTTHAPILCAGCGAQNHPAASVCPGCGATLKPRFQSEATRLS